MRIITGNSKLSFNALHLCVLLVFGCVFGFDVKAQYSKGGIPESFRTQGLSPLTAVMLERPFLPDLDRQDSANDRAGLPYRFAVNVAAGLNTGNSGQWENLPDGSKLWRLRVRVPGAHAITCYFDKFYLPQGASLFLYKPDHSKTIGAYTSENNQDNGLFATELIDGDEIIMEYHEPQDNTYPAIISLSDLAYAYRGVRAYTKSGNDYGGSGACEVNVMCYEGNDWADEKQGVMRIMVKLGTASYWCSGSLVNNTRQDFKPYVLTADHCGQNATPANLSQWIFYFNYESAGCPKPNKEPDYTTILGAEWKSSSGYQGGVTASDFYLVLLKHKVPESINPYYNGWTRQNLPSSSGVSIHHPEGDIKKISTYTSPTTSATWTSIPGTHWALSWVATANGYGVTEGGSSGAPLFDANHLIMGQLSGGGSSCGSPSSPDYYGKFSYSWNPAGSDSTGNLKYWLDPDNVNPTTLLGLKPNIVYVHVNFAANPDTIIVGNTVDFTDLSIGAPDQWLWTFTGGDPYQSTDQNPTGIRYNKSGYFNVTLEAANSSTSQKVTKYLFITVIPNIYPNPCTDKVFIDMGDNTIGDFSVEAHDVLGRPVKMYIEEIIPNHKYALEPANKTPGLIYLKIKSPEINLNRKVIFVRPPK